MDKSNGGARETGLSTDDVLPGSRSAERLANLRDVGGLPLTDGGVTNSGVLYRSDASYDGDAAPSHLLFWPPATVVDLRTAGEIARVPYAWPEDTAVHHRPLHAAAVPANLRGGDIGDVYGFILDSAPDRVAGVVDLVATQPGPVLVHCAAGKDRTGIVVAALLLTAGVEPRAVIDDYVATSANMPAVVQRLVARGLRGSGDAALPGSWAQAPREAVQKVIERLTSHPEGVEGWLVEHGAAPARLAHWRARLTDQEPVR